MGVEFFDDMMDMFPEQVTATPGILDARGKFIPSGSVLVLPCKIEGKARLVRDQGGHLLSRDQASRETISTLQVIIAGFNQLTTDLHRYTLPANYAPRLDLQALYVEKESDEDGPLYEVVWFP